MKINSFTIALCLLLSSNVFAQKTPDGKWEGAILVQQFKLGIIVNFKTENDSLKASIDIPQQGAKNIVLKNVIYKAPELSFDLETPIGPGKFKGINKDSIIDGPYEQGTMTTTFYLKPFVPVKEEIPTYKQEEITFKNKDITLAGTLTLPENTTGPVPAVILITGSGTQNRDEELFDFKPFKVIANDFTKKGIAVLRYDDRGAGGSTGNGCDATSADFAKDVEAAFKYLQTRMEINPKKIGLMGHSEGGAIAPMVAANNKDVAFIISMAGSGISGEEITMEQSRLGNIAAKVDPAVMKKNLAQEQRFLNAVKTGKGMEDFKKEMLEQTKQALKEQDKTMSDDELEKAAAKIVGQQMHSTNCAWYKYFISYNPAIEWKKVKCPVLGLFGGLDTQVPAIINNPAIKKALHDGGNDNYTSHIFVNANHLFIPAHSGSASEYATLPKHFTDGFLDTCTGWIVNLK